jgi:6-phosphogluconolactonase
MINKVWLNNGDIPRQNINLIRAELGPNDGAINYEKVINNVAYFDIVLLSMGEDGHTASLFPGHSYDENKMVVFEHNSPKYPKERISMSYSRLNQSKNVFKVVNGISKKKALDKWINGHKLPINKINGDLDKVFVCVS